MIQQKLQKLLGRWELIIHLFVQKMAPMFLELMVMILINLLLVMPEIYNLVN